MALFKHRPPGRFKRMRNAIDHTEMALTTMKIEELVKRMEGASDNVYVKIHLGVLRRLAACYPELNSIINDPRYIKE